MKKQVVSVLIISVFYFQVNAQKVKDLNGEWNFKTDPYEVGVDEDWFSGNVKYHGWDQLIVPGNWDIENQYAYYIGTAWYQKSFELSKSSENTYFLKFEGVYHESVVYLNGLKIGENIGGFLPFEIDVTNYLKDGKNNLVVKVNNTFKLGATWNWGGIRRPVTLEISNRFRVDYHHITAIPDLKSKRAEINGEISIENFADHTRKIEIIQSITDGTKELWSTKEFVELKGSSSKRIAYKENLAKIIFWEPNNPKLYQSNLKFYEKGNLIWVDTVAFGVRKVEIDGTTLLLNGNVVKPVGINLVPDDRIYGNSYPIHRIKEDVALLKSLGVQFARLSHLPLPREFLLELDKQGIMVLEEVSLWGKDKMVDPANPIPFDWLERMIKEKFNHPSVVGWSVGNEIGYRSENPKVDQYVEKAIKIAHTLDSSRLAVYVSHSVGNQKDDATRFSDLVMVNRYNEYENSGRKIQEDFPNRAIFFAELGKNLNSENPHNSEIPIKLMYNELRKIPSVIGVSLWTFNDYRSIYSGSPSWTTPKSENRSWGIVTVFREKKNQFSALQREHLPFVFTVKIEDHIFEMNTTKRSITSFPYYDFPHYKMFFKEYNLEGKLIEEVILPIPKNKKLAFQKGTSTIEYGFKDPQGNEVFNEKHHFQVPAKPSMIKVHTASEKIRVIFENTDRALNHVAFAKDHEGKIIYSDTTSNSFLDIEGLKYNVAYNVQLVAINNIGTNASDNITVVTDEDILPPVVWSVRPIENAIMINYGVEDTDMTYRVRYGTEPGSYLKEYELRNYGVLKIPDLENNTPYYFQISRRSQTGVQSEWSHEIIAVPVTIN